MYKRQIYHNAESNRIEKIDSVARIESKLFCPNWNALYCRDVRITDCRRHYGDNTKHLLTTSRDLAGSHARDDHRPRAPASRRRPRTAHRQSYTRHNTQLSARGAHRIFFQGMAIGGGMGQRLGGHHGECGARAYNGGLGAEPPAGSRGRASGPGVKRAKPPEAESILDIGCPTDSLNNNCICISTLQSVI